MKLRLPALLALLCTSLGTALAAVPVPKPPDVAARAYVLIDHDIGAVAQHISGGVQITGGERGAVGPDH